MQLVHVDARKLVFFFYFLFFYTQLNTDGNNLKSSVSSTMQRLIK